MINKLYLLSILLINTLFLSAQVFFTESFETPGDYTAGNAGDCSCVTATVDASDGQNDHFTDANETEISHNTGNDYSGEAGTRFWASEDNDDNGVGGSGNPWQCITLTVNIAGKVNLQFSGLFGGMAAPLPAPTPYEPENDMEVSYQIDGGGFTKVLDWHANAALTNISLDTDNDGFGDGTFPLSGTMQTVTTLLPGTGTTLDIQICTNSNSSGEEFAIDLIQVAEVALVPVEFAKFAASRLNKKETLLEWTTYSETNNKGFDVEYSMDGSHWETLGFVAGQGTTNSESDYEYLDYSPSLSRTYYRLKQFDFNGDFKYSAIRSVTMIKEQLEIVIAPNPSNGSFTLEIPYSLPEKTSLRLIDSRGVVLWERTFVNGIPTYFKENIDLLQPGVYQLFRQTGAEIYTERVLVLK